MNKILILKRKYFFRDILIAIIIALSPFIFFAYNFAPKNTKVWETKLFTINLVGNNDIDYLLWMISSKLLLITIISVWFVTCKHWWRLVILMPFSIELFKFLSIINKEFLVIPNYNFIYIFPILISSILILFHYSNKLNFYSYHKNINNELNEEIDILLQNLSHFRNKNYKDFKQQLLQLRKEKNILDEKEYLEKLIKLREAFSTQK